MQGSKAHGYEGGMAGREALEADLAGMRRIHDLHARLATETDLRAALEEIVAVATASLRGPSAAASSS